MRQQFNIGTSFPAVMDFGDRLVIGQDVFDRNLNWLGDLNITDLLQRNGWGVVGNWGVRAISNPTVLTKWMFMGNKTQYDHMAVAQAVSHTYNTFHSTYRLFIDKRQIVVAGGRYTLTDDNRLLYEDLPVTQEPIFVGYDSDVAYGYTTNQGRVENRPSAVTATSAVGEGGGLVENLRTQWDSAARTLTITNLSTAQKEVLTFAAGEQMYSDHVAFVRKLSDRYWALRRPYPDTTSTVNGVFDKTTGKVAWTTLGVEYFIDANNEICALLTAMSGVAATTGTLTLYKVDWTEEALTEEASINLRYVSEASLNGAPGSGHHGTLFDFSTNTLYWKRYDDIYKMTWLPATRTFAYEAMNIKNPRCMGMTDEYFIALDDQRQATFIPRVSSVDVSLRWSSSTLELVNGQADITLNVSATKDGAQVVTDVKVQLDNAVFADGSAVKVVSTKSSGETPVQVHVTNPGQLNARVVK